MKKLIFVSIGLLILAGSITAKQAASWQNKLDSGMNDLVYRHKLTKSSLASAEKDKWVDAILYLSAENIDKSSFGSGIEIISQRGRVALAKIDLNHIAEISSSPEIVRISASGEMHLLDDKAITSIKALRVREKLGVTGKNVIVGVLDTGIDIHHPDFTDRNGKTRIMAYLDLTYPDFADESVDLSGFERPYGGVLLTEEQINRVLVGGLELPEGLGTDYKGHGTLCAGIATANSWSAKSGYVSETELGGIAPDSRIVAIKASSSLKGRDLNQIKLLYGLLFLDSLATASNMPYVANMSVGAYIGSHDGLNEPSEYVASFITGENGRGKAFVAAAGNERDKGKHASADLTPGTPSVCSFNIVKSGSALSIIFINIFTPKNHPGATLTVITPTGDTLGTFDVGTRLAEPVTSEYGYYQIFNSPAGPIPVSGYNLIEFVLSDGGYYDNAPENYEYDIMEGEWKLLLDSEVAGTWQAYMIIGGDLSGSKFTSNISEQGTINDPAAREEIIAVGSYISTTSWVAATDPLPWYLDTENVETGLISPFSSIGPTPAGILKPEITAPGQLVCGTMSMAASPLKETNSMFFKDISIPLLAVSPDTLHGFSQGTSFACPQVAGICALLLEADPTLTHEEIKQILISTATPDTISTPVPNNVWGYGRANAVDAVAMALGISEENSPSMSFATRTFPDSAKYADSVHVYLLADFDDQYRQALKKMDFSFSWPDSLVTMSRLSFVNRQLKNINWTVDSLQMANGEIGLSAYTNYGLIDNDTLLAITLKPSSGNTAENISLGIENLSIEGDISPQLDITSKVNISLPEPFNLNAATDICLVDGDVNGSGNTDIFDLLELLNLLVSEPADYSPCADVNSDLSLDIFNLLALLGML